MKPLTLGINPELMLHSPCCWFGPGTKRKKTDSTGMLTVTMCSYKAPKEECVKSKLFFKMLLCYLSHKLFKIIAFFLYS